MKSDIEDFIRQLERLPGGPGAALSDFFGHLLAGSPTATLPDGIVPPRGTVIECWPLPESGALCLCRAPGPEGASLVHLTGSAVHEIASLDAVGLGIVEQAAATAGGTGSPLLLALVAIAMGQVDDGRRLKKALPRIDGAARDLTLMTVCRLCG
jgi:hypothetical protein